LSTGKTDLRLMQDREIPEPETRCPEPLFQHFRPILEYTGKLTILRRAVHMDVSALEQQIYPHLSRAFQIKMNGARVRMTALLALVRLAENDLSVIEPTP
jgi:hypothetical protein